MVRIPSPASSISKKTASTGEQDDHLSISDVKCWRNGGRYDPIGIRETVNWYLDTRWREGNRVLALSLASRSKRGQEDQSLAYGNSGPSGVGLEFGLGRKPKLRRTRVDLEALAAKLGGTSANPKNSAAGESVNPRGNNTALTVVLLEIRCTYLQGNRRDRLFFDIDPKIERTLTKHIIRVKFQKALQGSPSEGSFSENFSEEDSEEGIFEEEIQDNMADEANNNQQRTLGDFTVPTTVSCGSSIVSSLVY
ncbi:hypothetical protein PIB30_063010 [Stylosanthes scabra]|uniref:Uncharacterized protein n=1 Tax=Stylosanthes scabra TaxID=79078 RepID=A0ABU6WM01_9FABA|nr:hypothetical protein [Stylosanthes scabra]